MPRISKRKKVMNDIEDKILKSQKDPFLVLLEWKQEELEHLTSQDVRALMDVRSAK